MKKFKLLLRVALASLLAFFVSFNCVVGQAFATGQFSQTCEDITLNDSILSATCEKIDGSYHSSSIDLNEYIGNLDGKLSWGDDSFSLTCKEIGLAQLLSTRQLVVSANCQQAIGGDNYSLSDIELDAHIANIDGTLTYE